jgi:hypothetical protein
MMKESAMAGERSAYVGWAAAGVVLLVTFVAAAMLWFIFHPW